MATNPCIIPSLWNSWLLPSQRNDIERMWTCLCDMGLTGRRLALHQDKADQEVFLKQVLSECNIVEEWYHLSLLENWIEHSTDAEPLNKRLQGEHWSVLRQQLEDVILVAVKSASSGMVPVVHMVDEVPSIPLARTRRQLRLSTVTEDVDRNLVEQRELSRWSKEFQDILRGLEAPILEELQMALDPDRALECLTGSYRASTVRGYVRAWKCFQRWLLMAKGKKVRTSAADYIDYIFFRRDEPCGRSVPSNFLQAAKWIESKAGLSQELQLASSVAFKSVVERISAELQSNAPPIKRAPRMLARMIEEMEAYVSNCSRPV